jgi:predicted transcriptional regulator
MISGLRHFARRAILAIGQSKGRSLSMAEQPDETLITLTADIVAAHVSNNNVAVSDLPKLIGNVHDALAVLGGSNRAPEPAPTPAVSARASIRPDHIVCLEDGKKLKMLRRHLSTDHGMTPAEYRAKWSLPKDYPMVAPNYSETRRALAVKIGLGRIAAIKAPGPKPKAATRAAGTVRPPRKA